MKNSFSIFTLSLLQLVSFAAAAPDKTALPAGPLIAESAPDFSTWKTGYTYRDPEPVPEEEAKAWKKAAESDPELAKVMAKNPSLVVRKPRVVELVTVKTGRVKQELMIFSSGKRGERWLSNQTIIKKDPFTGKITWSLLPEETKENDFADFAWISEKNFKEIKKISGKDCLIFADKIPQIQADDGRMYQALDGFGVGELIYVTAAIDLSTRLPVSLEYDGLARAYTFGDPPTQMLSLPSDLALELQKSEKRARSMSAPMAAP